MELVDVIKMAGLAPEQVTVMFHVSDKPKLQRDLPRLVEEEHHLFDVFQNQHSPRQQATVKSRKYMMSFVQTPHRAYVFAGVYEVRGHKFQTNAELDAHPLRTVLRERYDDILFTRDKTQETGRLVFDLLLTDDLSTLRGRLHVEKPKDRAYARKAETLTNCTVSEITKDANFIPPMPSWDALVMTAQDIRTIAQSWADKLSQWRGIYHIVDMTDGARYVGSAYGAENILGRWKSHVNGDRGVTIELAKRNPNDFRFSILELLAPNAVMEDVVMREGSWKERLGTRMLGGLNKN